MRIKVTRSIAYAQGARHTLDVVQPRGAAAAPVVMFFYGGGWQSGNKGMYRYVAKALGRRGLVAIVPDYRVYPEVRYPDFIEDGALAVRWAKDHAHRFGGDPNQIVLMGHSAGAHIAAMLAVDGHWLAQVTLTPQRDIAGLIGISGPYDFMPLKDDTLATIFGGANVPATQPIAHVSGGAPPALLMTGAIDTVVDPCNSTRFAERLHAAGNEAAVVTYPNVGHYRIVAAFAPVLRLFAPVLDDAAAFIARVSNARTSNAPTPNVGAEPSFRRATRTEMP